jgi:uncharacterized membrane protein
MSIATKTATIAASAVATIVGVSAALAATAVPAPTTYQFEKCYGVNASGKNDCGVQGVHSCGGESRLANDPRSWIYVPAGTCAKINGGSTSPKA